MVRSKSAKAFQWACPGILRLEVEIEIMRPIDSSSARSSVTRPNTQSGVGATTPNPSGSSHTGNSSAASAQQNVSNQSQTRLAGGMPLRLTMRNRYDVVRSYGCVNLTDFGSKIGCHPANFTPAKIDGDFVQKKYRDYVTANPPPGGYMPWARTIPASSNPHGAPSGQTLDRQIGDITPNISAPSSSSNQSAASAPQSVGSQSSQSQTALPRNMPRQLTFQNLDDVLRTYGFNPIEFTYQLGLRSTAKLSEKKINSSEVQESYRSYVRDQPPPRDFVGHSQSGTAAPAQSNLQGELSGQTLVRRIGDIRSNISGSSRSSYQSAASAQQNVSSQSSQSSRQNPGQALPQGMPYELTVHNIEGVARAYELDVRSLGPADADSFTPERQEAYRRMVRLNPPPNRFDPTGNSGATSSSSSHMASSSTQTSVAHSAGITQPLFNSIEGVVPQTRTRSDGTTYQEVTLPNQGTTFVNKASSINNGLWGLTTVQANSGYDKPEFAARLGLTPQGYDRILDGSEGLFSTHIALARANGVPGAGSLEYFPRSQTGSLPKRLTYENRDYIAEAYGKSVGGFAAGMGYLNTSGLNRQNIKGLMVQVRYRSFVQQNQPPNLYGGPLSPSSVSANSQSTTHGQTLQSPLGATLPNPQSSGQDPFAQQERASSTSPLFTSPVVTSQVHSPFSDQEFREISGGNTPPSPRSNEGVTSPTSPVASHHSSGTEWDEIEFVARTPSPAHENRITSASRPNSPAVSEESVVEMEEVAAFGRAVKLEDVTPSYVQGIGKLKGLDWEKQDDIKWFQDEYLRRAELPAEDLESIKRGQGGLSDAVKQTLFATTSGYYRIHKGQVAAWGEEDW